MLTIADISRIERLVNPHGWAIESCRPGAVTLYNETTGQVVTTATDIESIMWSIGG